MYRRTRTRRVASAMHCAKRAYQVHDGGLIYLKHARVLANLRGDPRYAALLKKLSLPTAAVTRE
jgi:hypothetical protein